MRMRRSAFGSLLIQAVVRMIAPTSDYPFMVEPGTVKL